MVMEFKFGLMEPGMKANGRTTKLTVKASFGTSMVMSSMVNGEMIKPTVMGFTLMSMARSTKDIGKTISNMVTVSRHGRMDHATKVTTKMERSMEKALTCGATALVT